MDIEKYSPKWLLNEIRNAESDTHALFKIIEFQNALTEQCNIANVVGRSEQYCEHAVTEQKNLRCTCCSECGEILDVID